MKQILSRKPQSEKLEETKWRILGWSLVLNKSHIGGNFAFFPHRPGNHDRAWNDPPLFDYQNAPMIQSNAAKLTKRVGFPPTSTQTVQTANTNDVGSSSGSQLNDAGAKPQVLEGLPPPPPSSSFVEASRPDPSCNIQDQEDFNVVEVTDVIELLERVLSNDKLDARKALEIKKRIDILHKKWSNNELNDKVKNGMYKLACSLNKEDYEEAEKIQRGLNVDYPSMCTPWMIAIRQLILALK